MIKDRIKKNTPIEMANLLFENFITKDQMKEILGVSDTGFYKSLNKLRAAGFRISSAKKTYHMWNYFEKVSFDATDKNTIARLMGLSFMMLPESKTNTFNNLMETFCFFGKENDFEEVKEKYNSYKKTCLNLIYEEKVEKITQEIKKGKNIKVILKNGNIIEITPKIIKEEKNRLYLEYKNKLIGGLNLMDNNSEDEEKKEELIALDSIAKITQKEDYECHPGENEVIFELYGRLVDSYLLKEDERIVHNSKDKLTVASNTKDKDKLYRRLLRYDTLCRIVFPQEDISRFTSLLDQALINLE